MDTTQLEIDIAERAKDEVAITRIIEDLADKLDVATAHFVRSRLRADMDYAQQALMRLEIYRGR
jgi:hypothetical protein